MIWPLRSATLRVYHRWVPRWSLVALVLAGCYRHNGFVDCTITCADPGGSSCPNGATCALDGYCHDYSVSDYSCTDLDAQEIFEVFVADAKPDPTADSAAPKLDGGTCAQSWFTDFTSDPTAGPWTGTNFATGQIVNATWTPAFLTSTLTSSPPTDFAGPTVFSAAMNAPTGANAQFRVNLSNQVVLRVDLFGQMAGTELLTVTDDTDHTSVAGPFTLQAGFHVISLKTDLANKKVTLLEDGAELAATTFVPVAVRGDSRGLTAGTSMTGGQFTALQICVP